ncbi:MAG: hypothetical protein IJV65_03440 [Kiritimatiellae bacterium]|nr:hypothetical protein [Kiritimatiellia bacterium]
MHARTSRRLAPLAAAALLLIPAAAPAQQQGPKGPAGTNPGDLSIVQITSPRDFEQKPPSVVAGTKNKRWGVFDVAFDVRPEWVDDMAVTFYVMLQNPKADVKNGERPLSFFTLTLSYSDVERGKGHKVGAVLQPAALKRYGRPMGLAAKISVGGKDVASMSEAEGRLKTADKWWEDQKILDPKVVQRRDGYLIDRMKSPFQLQDNDNYEESR